LLERFIAALAWTSPREMTGSEVERVISQFVDTARLMADAGFSGIELHGAHGYLIGMFHGWFSSNENGELMGFITDQFLSGKVKLLFSLPSTSDRKFSTQTNPRKRNILMTHPDKPPHRRIRRHARKTRPLRSRNPNSNPQSSAKHLLHRYKT
jgi:hypothetical protein